MEGDAIPKFKEHEGRIFNLSHPKLQDVVTTLNIQPRKIRIYTIIRDPLERLISYHIYQHYQSIKETHDHIYYNVEKDNLIKGFRQVKFIKPQYTWALFNDVIYGDWVKLEGLHGFIDAITDEFDLNVYQPLRSKNTGKYHDFMVNKPDTKNMIDDFYDDDLLERTRKYYAKDIELYNEAKK